MFLLNGLIGQRILFSLMPTHWDIAMVGEWVGAHHITHLNFISKKY